MTPLSLDELPEDRDVAERLRLAERIETREHTVVMQKVERWGKVAAIAMTIGTFLGAVMTSLGMRMVGPPADIAMARADARRADSVTNARVDAAMRDIETLKYTAQSNKDRIANMESDLRVVTYAVCINLRRNDPASVPPECNTVIRRGASINP